MRYWIWLVGLLVSCGDPTHPSSGDSEGSGETTGEGTSIGGTAVSGGSGGSSDGGTEVGSTGGGSSGGTDGGEIPEEDLPRIMAQTWCGLLFACDCEGGQAAYADLETCVSTQRSFNEGFYAAARDNGLVYDPACAATTIARLEDAGCALERPSTCELPGGPCALFHGEEPVGARCQTTTAAYSDCQQGLRCYEPRVTCVAACRIAEPADVGDACFEDGIPVATCVDGTLCDTSTNACVPAPGDGEPCVGNGCAQGLYCRDRTTCVPRAPNGEPCGGGILCLENCVDGVCTARPSEGDPCARSTNPCADGLQCVHAVCKPAKAQVCGFG